MATDYEHELVTLRAKRDVSFFDLYSIDQLSEEDIGLLFELARKFRDIKTAKLTLCKGRSQVNAFFEASTRTMSSFDLAAKNLGMDTTSISSTGSSTKKGESFIDTVETVDAYNLATIVLRTSQAGASEFASRHVRASILNAGDGWHEHPTQGLLDALTIVDEFGGSLNLSGRTVTIVGDILHSRVFGSLVRILKKLKADIRVAAPQTFLPEYVENFGVTTYYSVEEALKDADVIYALRVQEERGAAGYIPTLREYSKTFGISPKRLPLAKSHAIIMHPGPVMRDIDVHSVLMRHPQNRILRQVENGMAVRKAVLWTLCERYDGKKKEYTNV